MKKKPSKKSAKKNPPTKSKTKPSKKQTTPKQTTAASRPSAPTKALYRLDFDELAKKYEESLYTVLRNFRTGPDFLETWVHDEDPNTSIYGIVEAADCARVPSLDLTVGEKTSRKIDRTRLSKDLSKLGTITWNKAGKNWTLQFRAKTESPGLRSGIPQPYQTAIAQAAKSIHHEGPLTGAAGTEGETLKFEASSPDGAMIRIAVNSKGVVTAAKHEGARDEMRAIFETYCSELVGRSAQEGADHVGIRVEHALRSPEFPREKGGIVTPENAVPQFGVPQSLVRDLFSQYLRAAKKPVERNFWRDPVSEPWMKLSNDERVKRVQATILQACRELRLQEKDIEVVGVKNDVRMILSYQQDPSKPDLGSYLIKIERILRQRLDPGIDLLLESREDRNKRKERTAKIVSELNTQGATLAAGKTAPVIASALKAALAEKQNPSLATAAEKPGNKTH